MFAARCGISQSALSGVLNGTKGSRWTFARIAEAHDMGYGDYFKDDKANTHIEQEAPALLSEEAREIWAEIGVIREKIKTIESQIKQHEHPQNGRPRNTAGGR